jgi:amino acid transporter
MRLFGALLRRARLQPAGVRLGLHVRVRHDGELLAWIIGWDLVLEYGVSVAAVAVGWGSYFTELLDSLFGVTLSDAISLPPGEGGDVNVPSLLLVMAAAALLVSGVRQSARTKTVMVITKIAVLLFFIVVAFPRSTATISSTSRPTASAASRRLRL